MTIIRVTVAFVLFLIAGGAHAQPSDAAVALHPACHLSGTPVDEEGFVAIGGMQQWVVVEGADCTNPVVLMVHGGPGNPNTPFAHALYGDWADEFTIVQWDQRGAGKTFAANPDEQEAPLRMNGWRPTASRWRTTSPGASASARSS